MLSRDIHIDIIAERFRNKMFDSEVMAALMRTLSDEDYDIRRNVVEIFTAAIAQGAPRCPHGIFILNVCRELSGQDI